MNTETGRRQLNRRQPPDRRVAPPRAPWKTSLNVGSEDGERAINGSDPRAKPDTGIGCDPSSGRFKSTRREVEPSANLQIVRDTPAVLEQPAQPPRRRPLAPESTEG